MFRKLCGDKNLESVVLATTHWEHSNREIAKEREFELQREEKYWAPLIKEGSRVLRHDRDKISGLEIIRDLMNRRTRVTLAIQRELVDKNMRLEQTGAGSELVTVVERLLQQYEEKIQKIERELEEFSRRDQDARERLEEAKTEFEEKFNKIQADAKKLQATHDQILADERFNHEQRLQRERDRHNEELRERLENQKEQLKKNFYRGMHDSSCLMM